MLWEHSHSGIDGLELCSSGNIGVTIALKNHCGTSSEYSHSGIAGFVDNDGLPRLVDVVVEAEVGRHSVQQHPVVRGHRGKLSLLASKHTHRHTQNGLSD